MRGIIGGAGSKSGVIGQTHAECDLWRVTSGWSGAASPIASNWERMDTDAEGVLGTGMDQSSGIFTFPRKGFWRVDFGWRGYLNGNSRDCAGYIYVTEDAAGGASYSAAAYASHFVQQTEGNHTTSGMYCSTIVKVTDTANIKVRFDVGTNNSSFNFSADSGANLIYGVFERLGDT